MATTSRRHGERDRHSEPLAEAGFYEPPQGFKPRTEHIEILRQALAATKFRVDYQYNRGGKVVLTIGHFTLTIDGPDDDALIDIDEMDRFVLLTQRLIDVLK